MHARDRRPRAKIIDAMQYSGDSHLERLADRMHQCCAAPLILASVDGDVCLSLQRCRCRMCPTCSRSRSIEAAGRVAELTKRMNSPRLITLTLKSTTEPLEDQIDRLLASAKALRRTKSWKRRVHGGVQTIEVTWHETSRLWHPHLHILVDGEYYPQPEISEAWLKVTGDSYIVDVRKVHDAKQAGRYVASYMTKHGQIANWPAAQITEYAHAMHGRRLVQTFGSSHGIECDKKPANAAAGELEPVATAREIENLAAEGCETAIDVLKWAHTLGYPWSLVWPAHDRPPAHAEPPDEAEVRAMIVAAGVEVRARSMPPPSPKVAEHQAKIEQLLVTPRRVDAQRFR